MTQAFICYASEDAVFADLLRLELGKAGIEVWVDEGRIHAGEEWRQAIDAGIMSASVCLVVITPSSSASPYVTYEWGFALGRGIKVIPLLQEQAELHPRLSVLQYLDFRDHRNAPWTKLFNEIAKCPSSKSEDDSDTGVISLKALRDEIRENLSRISGFVRHGYRVQEESILDKTGSRVDLDAVTCTTAAFDSSDIRRALSTLSEEEKTRTYEVYRGFQKINDKAASLERRFRPWLASHYLAAVSEFEEELRSLAERLASKLGEDDESDAANR